MIATSRLAVAAVCLRAASGLTLTASRGDPAASGGGFKVNPGSDLKQAGHLPNDIMQNLQSFIAGSGGSASLVLMGDSTVSGMVNDFVNFTDAIAPGFKHGSEVWNTYVSNDRPKSIHHGLGWVHTGEEWVDPEAEGHPVAKEHVKLAQAATKALHAKGCKWGGGLDTYVFGGDLEGLVVHSWGFLPEYSEACWDSCFTDAMAALKPSAVMWNIGFHLLNHDFKKSTCEVRHNPTKLKCGDYKEMVTTGMTELASVVPQVVWRTTNWLCEAKVVESKPFLEHDLNKWKDPSSASWLEKQCQKDCPQYGSLSSCRDWLFDATTTERLYTESMDAIAQLPKKGIHVLDAFKQTKDCCGAGCDAGTWDGEHYRGLDRDLVRGLAAILSQK